MPQATTGMEVVPEAKWSLGIDLISWAGLRCLVRSIPLITKAFSLLPIPSLATTLQLEAVLGGCGTSREV